MAGYLALQWVDTRYPLFGEWFGKWGFHVMLVAILALQIGFFLQVRRKKAPPSASGASASDESPPKAGKNPQP